MEHKCLAQREYERVKGMSAFNVQGNYAKEGMNQHLIKYYFKDGSTLFVRKTKNLIGFTDGKTGYAEQRTLFP